MSPEVPLQVITPADTRASTARARRSLEKAVKEIVWQVEMEGWRTLGYPSWSAMCEAEYADAAFMVPSKNRLQVVARTRAEQKAAQATVTAQAAVTLQCEGCGTAMTGRADRKFCSSACRQKAYRNRNGA